MIDRSQCGIRVSTAIADSHRLLYVAVGIDGQSDGVSHSRIGSSPGSGWRIIRVNDGGPRYLEEPALIVKVDRFPRVRKEDTKQVWGLRLEDFDGVVALGSAVGTVRLCASIKGIDLLAEDRAAKRAAGLPQLFAGRIVGNARSVRQQDCRRQDRIVEEHQLELALAESADAFVGVPFRVIFVSHVPGDGGLAEIGASVKPGLCPGWRNCGRGILIVGLWEVGGIGEGGKLFGVPLIDSAKAAELAFHAIKVAVVVGKASHKTVATNVVVALHALNHMHGERKAREPRCAGNFVGDVELRGRGILDQGLCAKIVRDVHQQMRLLPAHQIDVA